jgi:hypothetical protein
MLATDGAGYDNFGVSVNIYGTAAMIGANGDDDKATEAGTYSTKKIAYLLFFNCKCVYRKCIYL